MPHIIRPHKYFQKISLAYQRSICLYYHSAFYAGKSLSLLWNIGGSWSSILQKTAKYLGTNMKYLVARNWKWLFAKNGKFLEKEIANHRRLFPPLFYFIFLVMQLPSLRAAGAPPGKDCKENGQCRDRSIVFLFPHSPFHLFSIKA